MSIENVKADYPCSQKDLYSVLETAWGNFETHINGFSDHKAMYDVNYGNIALDEIRIAKNLPDDDARSGSSRTFHVELVELGKSCTKNFMLLKSFIETAFPNEEIQKIQFDVAGQNYYRNATNEDWESVVAMNTNAKRYITENIGVLTANNNMRPAFETIYTVASDDFDLKYADFKEAEETSVGTAAKIRANNDCYKKGMDMMRDGQRIYVDAPEIAVKFVFKNLWDLINPPVAGIRGSIKESITFLPLGNVSLVAQRENSSAVNIIVDLNGEFAQQLPEGKYKVSANAIGYVEQVFEMDLKLTGFKTLNVELVKE